MSEKTKKRGRPPLSPKKRRVAGLSLKFLPQVREQIDHAARLDKDEAAPWGRRICEIAAEHRIVHGITIQEAYAAAMVARGLTRK